MNLIRKSTGLDKKKWIRVYYNDLDDLAGGWGKEDEQEFNETTQLFYQNR